MQDPPPLNGATTLPPAASGVTTSTIIPSGVTTTQTQLLPTSISTAAGASASANVTGINGSGSRASTGAIVAGTLGALLLITITVLLIIFWRRHKARQQKALEKVQVQQPFYSDMHHPHHGGNSGGLSHYQILSNARSPFRRPEPSPGYEAIIPSTHGSVAPLLPAGGTSSRRAEHLAGSLPQAYTAHRTPESNTNHGRVVNHEDSGYRIRSAWSSQALEGGALDLPPSYTIL